MADHLDATCSILECLTDFGQQWHIFLPNLVAARIEGISEAKYRTVEHNHHFAGNFIGQQIAEPGKPGWWGRHINGGSRWRFRYLYLFARNGHPIAVNSVGCQVDLI